MLQKKALYENKGVVVWVFGAALHVFTGFITCIHIFIWSIVSLKNICSTICGYISPPETCKNIVNSVLIEANK